MNDMTNLQARLAKLDTYLEENRWATEDPVRTSDETQRLLAEVFAIYLQGTDKQRCHVRSLFADHIFVSFLLFSSWTRATELLKLTKDPKWLIEALAAFSINDLSGTDYRDCLQLLGNLYLASAYAGIDPLPHFDKIASISNSKAIGKHIVSTKQFLQNFPQSSYFLQTIKPDLDKEPNIKTDTLIQLEARIVSLNARRGEWKWAPDDPLAPISEEILQVLDEVCSFHLTATPKQRRYIRELLRRNGAVHYYLESYVYRAIERLRATRDAQWIRLGLAAVDIDDNDFGDPRDQVTILGNLFVAAEKTGIEPQPHFQAVAAIASPDVINDFGESTQSILAHFHKSAILEEARASNTDPMGNEKLSDPL